MNPDLVRRSLAVFGRISAWLEPIRSRVQPHLDKLLENLEAEKESDETDFGADADYIMMLQQPVRATVLIRSVLIVAALFIMWAAVAPMNEISRGEGKVVPSRQLQVLQSLDGGIVSEILVKEGQIVVAGQVLLRIDPTRFVSSVRENRSQYLSLLAKAARLRALTEGKSFEPPPEVVKEDPQTLEDERHLYDSRVNELNSALSVARQQLSQKQHELVEMQAKREEAAQAYVLSSKELEVTKPLMAAGAVSEVELLRLERDVSRFKGERDQATAQISRAQAAISEASHKLQEVELNFRNDSGKELAETLSKLGQITEGNVGLADKVKHSELRSPVRGTIKRILVNTVGGVVQPGKDVAEIVPLDDTLLLEARVMPRDIAFLHPGQHAIVRLTAYDYSIYGGMEATLEQISADSVTDEKGATYYLVRVRTKKSSLGQNLPVIPGMVAEVDIVTGQKSFLAYLLKPILRAKYLSFTER